MKQYDYDFVVVGSGLAGLLAAYHASAHGTVALISKSELDISNSYHAQGGIAAAIGRDDSPDYHFADTLVAGRNLCDHDAVRILVEEGLSQVRKMIGMGVPFDRDSAGELILGLEGGHSQRRILHADGDATGKVMTSFMLGEILKIKNITTYESTAAIHLMVSENYCFGVQALDFNSGENLFFRSRATILATGGLSRIYERSTNPNTATGDGFALAWEAGAQLADMEFVQFHPTALSVEGEEAYLISEAVRGEGAYLLDCQGNRFMIDLHPMAELAPRDVVASAIFNKIQETKAPVSLSLGHLNPEIIRERFPSIAQKLHQFGLDLTRDPIPVAPAAHYTVGGIRTDCWGRTNIEALFACGEVASTGVMGANRLASNSLLECLVFGERLVQKAKELPLHPFEGMPGNPYTFSAAYNDQFLVIKNELSQLMGDHAGIVRTKEGLTLALIRIEAILQEFQSDYGDYNRKKIADLATVCHLICRSALEREESRGGHIRTDFPDEDDHYLHHTLQRKGEKITTEPIRTTASHHVKSQC
ncbi:MAG: L-aspartate oxidase [Marinilabiliales bacterium]|nr:L-aspartate oxidase [Marinilabiliales bacterium]